MTKNDERREQNRHESSCQCWIEQDSVTLLGTATNLSKTGLFLETLPIIKTGSNISIKIEIQDMGNLHAEGKIRWRNMPPVRDNEQEQTKRDSTIPGLGIEFSSITKGKKHLEDYISGKKFISKSKL